MQLDNDFQLKWIEKNRARKQNGQQSFNLIDHSSIVIRIH